MQETIIVGTSTLEQAAFQMYKRGELTQQQMKGIHERTQKAPEEWKEDRHIITVGDKDAIHQDRGIRRDRLGG